MSTRQPAFSRDVEKCVDDVIKRVGKKIVFGMPLGLGKPNHVANELYRRAKEDPSIDLTILTALSLEKPTWSSELERRFLEPFLERVFGGYVDLEYVKDLRSENLPPNVTVKEFFAKAGSYLNIAHAQQNYISSNYTHAYRDILINDVNVVAQIVSKDTIGGKTYYSTSCNPEVNLDVVDGMRRQESEGKKIATRNLWISIPSLLCGFAVWLYWSVITVQMLNLGFPFTNAELFTLSSIAGWTDNHTRRYGLRGGLCRSHPGRCERDRRSTQQRR